MNKLLLSIIGFMIIATSALSAPAVHYVTVAGADTKTGATWATAMGYAEFETDCEGAMEAGDTYYFEAGTYTLTSDLACSFATGTPALPISFIGVASGTSAEPPTISDWAYGDDRPLIAGAGYNFGCDDYCYAKNFRMTCTDTTCFYTDLNSFIYNFKVVNSSGTADRKGMATDDNTVFLNVELVSTNGIGVSFNYAYRAMILYSYIHDSKNGINATNLNGGTIANNVFDTISAAGISNSNTSDKIYNNTFYNCLLAIDAAVSSQILIVNNIFDNNGTGVSADASVPATIIDYNVWSNSATADVTNVTKGEHAITSDITLTNPASGDFTLPDSSVAEGVAMQVGTNIGITGDYNWNIGVDQTDTQSGGGGGTTSYGFSN